MIKWERVSELRSEVGDDAFDEIVALFLEETDEVVARISDQCDQRAIEADLHFLKGAALNLGFSDFANLCQDGERAAARGHAVVDPEALQGLYLLTKAAFVAGLARLNAA
ncbi:MAG: Hpt domain-containing protein [Cypionkella sp.]|nr:Hpt domain-containing protein [Cypionkella sp.]